jgi:hypothetical protein
LRKAQFAHSRSLSFCDLCGAAPPAAILIPAIIVKAVFASFTKTI